MTNNLEYNFTTRVWEDGFTGTIKVTNKGEIIGSWQLVFDSEFAINQQEGDYEVLGAEIVSEETLADGTYRYVIQPLNYNSLLDPNESIFITFNSIWNETAIPDLSNTSFLVLDEPPEPGKLPADYEFEFDVNVNPWSGKSGATVFLDLTNTGDVEIPDVELKFESDFQIRAGANDLWGATVISETLVDGSYEYVLSLSGNEDLSPGEQHSLGFNTEDYTPEFEYIILGGSEGSVNPPSKPPVDPPMDYEFDVDMEVNQWSHNSGATVVVDITNTDDVEIPNVEVKFESDFQIRNIPNDLWGATVISETFIDGSYEYILSLSGNEDLSPGEQHSFGLNTEDPTPEFEYIALNGSELDVEPSPNPPTPPIPPILPPPGVVARPNYNHSTGFFTLNGKVYDANGNEFVARGLNNRHVWFDNDGHTEAINALDNIAGFGFNSVRIVWEVDHDVNPTDAVLERAIQTTIDNNMVPMVEIHDFTGRNDTHDLLNRGVKWWTDRAWMWEKYEKSLMINIANEFGDYNMAQGSSRAMFPQVYTDAITRIRNAGNNNTIVIDPFHYGKDYTLIEEYGAQIVAADPQQNVVFSVHFYCGEGADPNRIRDAFDSITGQGLPMMVGEFGPTHAPCGDVREDVIMAEAEAHDVGYYAWAWDDAEWAIGSHWEADSRDELTPFGRDLVYGPNGIQETAEIATIFEDF